MQKCSEQGWDIKDNLRIFIIHFLNSDFSINICSIFAKFLENVVQSITEGSVSQFFYLGPTYFFMLCRNLGKLFFHYYLRFVS